MNWHEIPRSLQLRYLHAAAITVAQLGRLLAEVERDAGTGGLQALKLMLRRFYGLAAWAGLNGLAAVWVAAQRGEHDCSTLAASHVMPQPAHLDQIGAQVDVLRHEIYRLRTNGGIGDEILWAMPLPEGLLEFPIGQVRLRPMKAGVVPPSPPEGREGGWGDAGGDPIDAGKVRDISQPRRRYQANRAGGSSSLA